MIPAAAVEEFLDQPRDDHRWLKDLTHKDIDRLLARLDPPPRPWPKLGLHQKVCLYLGIKYGRFAFWLDMGCVDGDTEFLTQDGWKAIRDYSEGDLVAQYEPTTRMAKLVKPRSYVNRPCIAMHHFKSARGCDQMLSPEHNMLVVTPTLKGGAKSHPVAWKHTPLSQLTEYTSKGWGVPRFYKVKPHEVVGKRVRFETTFLLDGPGIALSDAQIRVQVAVHAAGHLPNKRSAAIRVKKERKKVRMRRALAEAQIEYKERPAADNYSVFYFVPPLHTKRYGPEWWGCTLDQKRVICDEVSHWDGSTYRGGGVGFFTRSKQCADFIQFCFASTRHRAFVSLSGVGYAVHAVGNGRTTNLATLVGGEITPTVDGRKYCFEVPSGYLVLRRNGNIFVTGNTGKTLIALELLQYWWDNFGLRQALVFVTSDKAFSTWTKQIQKYKINIPYIALDASSSEEKWRLFERFDEGIILLHYPGTVAMVSEHVVSKKGKGQLELVDRLTRALMKRVDAVVFDESTRASNRDALTYRVCRRAAKAAEFRYALAGKPFGRDPTPLWAQHYLIDDGKTLGETLGLFRETFFTAMDNFWSTNPYSKKYKFKKAMQPELSRLLQHRSLAYAAEECIDVPQVRHIIERIKLPMEARGYYRTVVEQVIAARGNLREMKNAFLRMRQLSSGFLGFKDDETGEKVEIEFAENPKMDLLLDLTDQLPDERKAIVFYEYTHSGRRITEALKKQGLKPVWLWSGTKNPTKELNEFMENSERVVAVINNKVGAYSLDGLQDVANYEFFFESPVSPIDRDQAEKRLIRQGQNRRVFIYDLVVQETKDEAILGFHAEGNSLFDVLLKNPGKIFHV